MTIETLVAQGHNRTHTGLAGIDTQRLKAMRNASLRACFNRLEETRYRMEFVARVRGREYINDAAARSINSTWYSFENVKGGLIWIAEAPINDVDYSRLVPLALRKVRMLLLLGGDNERMRKSFSGIIPTIETCPTMADALQKAYHYEADDVKVLYSPACDNGHSVEERGESFRREVNEL